MPYLTENTMEIILIIWCKTYLIAFRPSLLTTYDFFKPLLLLFILVQGDVNITNSYGLFTFYFLPATLKAVYFIGTNYMALKLLC